MTPGRYSAMTETGGWLIQIILNYSPYREEMRFCTPLFMLRFFDIDRGDAASLHCRKSSKPSRLTCRECLGGAVI